MGNITTWYNQRAYCIEARSYGATTRLELQEVSALAGSAADDATDAGGCCALDIEVGGRLESGLVVDVVAPSYAITGTIG